jgi:hypothetical protein
VLLLFTLVLMFVFVFELGLEPSVEPVVDGLALGCVSVLPVWVDVVV